MLGRLRSIAAERITRRRDVLRSVRRRRSPSALTARFARIAPAPRSNGSAGVTPSSLRTSCSRRRHQCRLDLSRRPVRVRGLDQRRRRRRRAGSTSTCRRWPGRTRRAGRPRCWRRNGRGVWPARICTPGRRDVGLDEVAQRAARGERGHHVASDGRRHAVRPRRRHAGVGGEKREQLGGVTRGAGGVRRYGSRTASGCRCSDEVLVHGIVEDHSGRAAQQNVVALLHARFDRRVCTRRPSRCSVRARSRPRRSRSGLAQVVRLAGTSLASTTGVAAEIPAVTVVTVTPCKSSSPFGRAERAACAKKCRFGRRSADRVRPRAGMVRGRRARARCCRPRR